MPLLHFSIFVPFSICTKRKRLSTATFSTEKLRGIVVKIITKKDERREMEIKICFVINHEMLPPGCFSTKKVCINVTRALLSRTDRLIMCPSFYLLSKVNTFYCFGIMKENARQELGRLGNKMGLYKSGTMGIVSKRKSLTHRSTQIPSGKIPLRKSKKVCLVHGPRLFSFSKNKP